MSHAIGASRSPFELPVDRPVTILVVDDDARVIELLEIAFGAHGWKVERASDGEQALRLATDAHPDLVVLDVRLPRRSGFEVCEALRRDPLTADLPVIMVSAVGDTDARVQGLARGADDYLAKPFSPKELVARIRRMLARSRDARESRRLGVQAEIELARSRDETQRQQQELRHARRVRELTGLASRDLARRADRDDLLRAFLAQAESVARTGLAVLLTPGEDPARLEPGIARGIDPARLSAVVPEREGEMVRLVDGLGRMVRLDELERIAEEPGEIRRLASAGITLLAPADGPEGLEALLALDDKRDGSDFSRGERELLLELLGTLATRLVHQRRLETQAAEILRLLITVADRSDPAGAVARLRAAEWIGNLARAELGWRVAARVASAIRLGAWADPALDPALLAAAAAGDRTGEIAHIEALVRGDRDDPEPVALTRFGRAWASARAIGAGPDAALEQGLATAGLDGAWVAAVRAAAGRTESGTPPPRDRDGGA
jgi:DNA-binding response OmpR family regulator